MSNCPISLDIVGVCAVFASPINKKGPISKIGITSKMYTHNCKSLMMPRKLPCLCRAIQYHGILDSSPIAKFSVHHYDSVCTISSCALFMRGVVKLPEQQDHNPSAIYHTYNMHLVNFK